MKIMLDTNVMISALVFGGTPKQLTGDKDFLESDIKHPIIFSPKMLMEYLYQKH